MMIIDDWLDDRISEHRFTEFAGEDPAEFEMLAGMIRAKAVAAGYKIEDLEDACKGDVARYLATQQGVTARKAGTAPLQLAQGGGL